MATAAVGPGHTVDMTARDIGSLYQGTVTYADSHCTADCLFPV
jgi:hypothetical protein